MRWLLVGQDLLLFIVPALIISRFKSREPLRWLHLTSSPSWPVYALALVLMIVAQPGINFLAYLNEQIALPSFMSGIEQWMQQMEQANAQTTEALMSVSSWTGIAANILVVGLLAALSEEILFRGAIQGIFSRGNVQVAVWATAILFSLMHLQFYGFIPRMLMGALFGYVLLWSHSLWLPIWMHLVNNTSIVIYYAMVRKWDLSLETLEGIGTQSTWWLGLLSIVLTALLIYGMYQYLNKHSIKQMEGSTAF